MQLKNLFTKTHYESKNGLFVLDLERIEGKPTLAKIVVTFIDGDARPLIYDAVFRRPADLPNWKAVKDVKGLPEGLRELLAANGLAVPLCMDCEHTIRQLQTDNGRYYSDCPLCSYSITAVMEGCKQALCPHFKELSADRRKQEAAERAAEIKAEEEWKEQQRLEELERKERERLHRKYGRDDDEKEEY